LQPEAQIGFRTQTDSTQ